MAKTKFRSLYNKGEFKFTTPTGQKTEMRHRANYKKNGERELICDKEVAIYDLIQASREECEIERIVKRAIEGDWNVLNAVNGMYADITNCPSSLAEAQQFIINAKEDFDNLPKEIRAKFNNDAQQYVAEMSNDFDSFSEKLGYKEALEQKEAIERAKQEINNNFAKAMENIANGATITQKGEVANE